MKNLHNFKTYTKLGLVSNCLFILFIVITMIYYSIYLKTGKINYVVEGIAYTLEIIGFILMLAAALGYVSRLRHRRLLKISACVYFVMEAILMLFDFNLVKAEDFYSPTSRALIIIHCVISAVICLSYMQLDENRKPLQIVVSISSMIMILGVITIIYNVRIYASVLINAVAYIFLYSAILFLLKREVIEVDCHGDAARVAEYDSTIF